MKKIWDMVIVGMSGFLHLTNYIKIIFFFVFVIVIFSKTNRRYISYSYWISFINMSTNMSCHKGHMMMLGSWSFLSVWNCSRVCIAASHFVLFILTKLNIDFLIKSFCTAWIEYEFISGASSQKFLKEFGLIWLSVKFIDPLNIKCHI